MSSLGLGDRVGGLGLERGREELGKLWQEGIVVLWSRKCS